MKSQLQFCLYFYVDKATDDQIQDLLLEGSMLKGLNHEYINPLIGVCLDRLPILIYPACDKGNLKYMLKKSNRLSEHFPVSFLYGFYTQYVDLP